MCGIFGYKGKPSPVHTILLHGLERLEYRGYDSAGILVGDKQGHFHIIKSVGKVSFLANKINQLFGSNDMFTFGIAHTRWATHGGISEENTHPHCSKSKCFYVVHNGIVENYYKLKQDLLAKGYTFYGQTDTEVIANLLEDQRTGNFLETVEKVLGIIRGAYALLIICSYAPDEMIAAKLGSPLLLGYTHKGEYFFSSDKQALAGYAKKILYLDDGEIVRIKGDDYQIRSRGLLLHKFLEDMDITSLEAAKGEYKHFMLKEIFEQPNIIRRVFKGRANFTTNLLTAEAFHGMQNEKYKKIVFIGCGTSYNAGSLGAYRMEDIAGIEASAEIASEYEYKNVVVRNDTLYVFVSQSGETADTIQALKLIKQKGGHTFGIVNVVGSTISRLTDYGLFTRAGVEIGVASTKAFTAQITCILLLVLYLGQKRGLSKAKYDKIMSELNRVPLMIEEILARSHTIRDIAKIMVAYKNFFFLGRHYQFPIACESSLKLKEITYLHSESYSSGELKHGPLALVDEQLPSILFVPYDLLFEKNISTIQEIQARRGKVIAVSDKDIPQAEWNIKISSTIDEIYPFLTVVVGQLLAYHIADILGRDIDKPRNLAKSVTVR